MAEIPNGHDKYPRLSQLIWMISKDNGGCTADEIELVLADCSDEQLEVLAAGDEVERDLLLEELSVRFEPRVVEALNSICAVAFDG